MHHQCIHVSLQEYALDREGILRGNKDMPLGREISSMEKICRKKHLLEKFVELEREIFLIRLNVL